MSSSWSAKRLRESWIHFFSQRAFYDVSNRSVIPRDSDKSLLFINSGVAAIKSYFCGDSNLPNPRLVSVQRVIRTGDIESIGHSIRHHTYFEMLGNFSIGKSSREEAISLAWEFLTEVLGLEGEKLHATVFNGDRESYGIWKRYLPESRIITGDEETNFWDMGVGPCGPCTEIYYDRGEEYDPQRRGIELLIKNQENDRYLEIWNLVFSDFINDGGRIVPSETRNLDTGAGMERLLMILENRRSTFETSLFTPMVEFLKGKTNGTGESLKSAADYFRTCCILLNDGIRFGNKGREYVLRKLFRRACSSIKVELLGAGFFDSLCGVIFGTLDFYEWDSKISGHMAEEWQLVSMNLSLAEDSIEGLLEQYEKEIPASEIFNLVSSRGIPIEYLESELETRGRFFCRKSYEALFDEHRVKSLNRNISSAFIRKNPAFSQSSKPTDFDYEARTLEAKVVDYYVGESFHKNLETEGEDLYVVLDRTVIFPLCAGQDCDLGHLRFGDQKPLFVDFSLKADNGQILHRLGRVDASTRALIVTFPQCIVSHEPTRRKSLEMNHTAEHLLYALLKRTMHQEITRLSGNKDNAGFSLEITAPPELEKTSFDLLKINQSLNKAISDSIAVVTRWGNLEEAKALNMIGKFEELYEMQRDRLRFVFLGDYGGELCIGTHVRNTQEIGSSLITRFRKGKGNSYRFQVITGLERVNAELGSTSMEDYLYRLQNKENLDKAKKAQEREKFQSEKEQLLSSLVGKDRIMVLERQVDPGVAMSVFREIRSSLNNQMVVLFFRESEGYRFFISSEGIPITSCLEGLREKGAKCGGNSSFGSGLYPRSDFPQVLDSLLDQVG